MTGVDHQKAFVGVTEALVGLIRAFGYFHANPVAVDLAGPQDGMNFLRMLPPDLRSQVEIRRENYDRGIQVDQVEVCGVLVRWPTEPRLWTGEPGLNKFVR